VIPAFGFTRAERIAAVLMMLSGIAGLVLSLTIRADGVAATVGERWPLWSLRYVGRVWLVCQSLLVVLSSLGALFRCFTLAAVGILAGLAFVTPVGLVTFIPALWMLLLVVPRRRAFWEFTPRWRGEGRPPPGQWR